VLRSSGIGSSDLLFLFSSSFSAYVRLGVNLMVDTGVFRFTALSSVLVPSSEQLTAAATAAAAAIKITDQINL